MPHALHFAVVAAAMLFTVGVQACEKLSCTEHGKGDRDALVANAEQPNASWSHPIAWSADPPQRVVIVGTTEDGAFRPSSVYVPDATNNQSPARQAPFALLANLVPNLDVRIFGAEERAMVSRDDEVLIIRCDAGARPAGVVLSSSEFRYPLGMHGELRVEGRSTSPFSVSLAMPGADAREELGSIGAPAGDVLAAIPSSSWQEGSERDLVINCPMPGATAMVSAIKVVPDGRRDAAGVGTWIWDIRPWLDKPNHLVARASQHSIEHIFLQLRIVDGEVADADSVMRLIGVLSEAGIAAHAVEGDADMATPAGRSNALVRARAIRMFMDAGGTLRSVQYDIEPYLRAGHVADPQAGWSEWALTVEQLADVFGRKVPIVVPSWMLDDAAGAAALERVARAISGVTVMAYRTDPVQVERFAEAWLNWGAGHEVQIGIALENGVVRTEFHRTFVRAERGKLLIDRSTPRQTVKMLVRNVTGSYTKPVYSFSHETEVDPARISFLGDQLKLAEATSRLGQTLTAWNSFDMVLVHELIASGGSVEPDNMRPE